MRRLNKVVKIVMKVLEVSHWVAVALFAAVAVCSVAAPQFLSYFMDTDALLTEKEISVYGFEVLAVDSSGAVNRTVLLLFAIGACLLLSLMAMIFRNFYLILKKAEGGSPFQPDNIRMLKEIGIFSISVPVVGLILSIVTRLIAGADAVEISVNMDGIIMGILVLCITRFFAHGAELEKDVEGLL